MKDLSQVLTLGSELQSLLAQLQTSQTPENIPSSTTNTKFQAELNQISTLKNIKEISEKLSKR